MSRLKIGPLNFDEIAMEDVVAHILGAINRGGGGFVVTPNVDILRQCESDSALAELVNAADLVLADGQPILWLARLYGRPLPERVAGSDLTAALLTESALSERRIFLLGGNPGAARAVAGEWAARWGRPENIAVECPSFGFENDEKELKRLGREISRFGPDLVFIGLGFPKQEQITMKLRAAAPKAWWLGVGYTFSFISGQTPRAPVLLQKVGLEWLHRLAMEPRRLFGRYVLRDFPFLLRQMLRASNLFRARGDLRT